MPDSIDLDAYFRRIHWTGATSPTFDTLAGLLRAHIRHIPFENLDVLLHRPIRLDLPGVQDKLVRAHRGGYCFEHATLFAALLEMLGFQPTRHSARVILFAPAEEVFRGHMFMTVPVNGTTYVVDPGFGPFAAPAPIPMADVNTRETGETHWMTRNADLWSLHVPRNGKSVVGWVTTLQQEYAIDFEVANHFTATNPRSAFTNLMMLSAATPTGRVSIMNRNVTNQHRNETTTTVLQDRAALRSLLREYFGFDLPEVDHLKVPQIPGWA